MKRRLDAAFVEYAKSPERGQVVYWDHKLPGFGLRVSCGGGKTWVYAYRHAGKMRWMKLGSYPGTALADARAAAHIARGKAQRGEDPASEKAAERAAQAASGVTFGDLAHMYVERHAKISKRTWRADRRMLEHDLLPAWGTRPLGDIKRADVVVLLDRIVDRGARTMANRVRSLVSTIFKFAVERGMLDDNPAEKAPRPGGKEDPRERVLNHDEVRAVWRALDEAGLDDRFPPIFKLGLLLGQREAEIVGMQWAELDLTSRAQSWTIPGERTKNGLIHRVPLVGEALDILKGILAGPHDSLHVFAGDRRGKPLSSVDRPICRLRELTRIADLRYHDLRRTARTGWAEIKIDDAVAERLLNHKDRGVQAVYNRYAYDTEKRAALARWDKHLARVIAGKATGKVVAIGAASA
jgi:integrase